MHGQPEDIKSNAAACHAADLVSIERCHPDDRNWHWALFAMHRADG